MNTLLLIIIILTVLSVCLMFLTCFVLTKLFIERKNSFNFYADYFLLNAVAPMMEIAEQNNNLNGEQKKELVIKNVSIIAQEKGYSFKLQLVSNRIEHIINLSKNINYDKF